MSSRGHRTNPIFTTFNMTFRAIQSNLVFDSFFRGHSDIRYIKIKYREVRSKDLISNNGESTQKRAG